MGAFSLVEVTIAVGIIAISMVSMLMLMPMGLSGMRAARTETVRAQIVQYMTSKAQLVAFTSGTAADGSSLICLMDRLHPLYSLATIDASGTRIKDPYYFDDQGRLLASQTLSSRYMVDVTKNDPSTIDTDRVIYPGSTAAAVKTYVATSVAKLTLKTSQMIPSSPPAIPQNIKTIGKTQIDVIFVPNQGG